MIDLDFVSDLTLTPSLYLHSRDKLGERLAVKELLFYPVYEPRKERNYNFLLMAIVRTQRQRCVLRLLPFLLPVICEPLDESAVVLTFIKKIL